MIEKEKIDKLIDDILSFQDHALAAAGQSSHVRFSEVDKLIDYIGQIEDEINTLTAKVKRYEEVLKYYSNIENFNFVQTDQDNIYLCEGINENEPLKNHPSEYDQLGKRARAALNKTGELEK